MVWRDGKTGQDTQSSGRDLAYMRTQWTDFVWDSRVFPDPEGMLKRIKAKGLNICIWINPYIGQESVLFNDENKAAYYLPEGIWTQYLTGEKKQKYLF